MKTSRRRVAFSVLRTLQVFAVVALHARFGGRDADDPRRRRARVLADAFESLGTTYVKIAQFLTTRPDVVPPVYIDELQRLQDDVEPEASADVVEVLESELGPVDEVFDEFEREPVSAASVAQVHRARVAGEEVAVKVQRPGLRESVDADLRAFRWIVRGVVALMRLAGHAAHAGTLVSVALDVEDSLRREVDFEREAALMDELRRGVEAYGFDTEVVVPRLYPGLSTDRVITMS
ncbi:MAG: ABC1 kinase family protein, partial [Halobacteriota archaeon]